MIMLKKAQLLSRAFQMLSDENQSLYGDVIESMTNLQLVHFIASLEEQRVAETREVPSQWPAMLAMNGKQLQPRHWEQLVLRGTYRGRIYLAQHKINGIRLRLERRGEKIFAISRHRSLSDFLYISAGVERFPQLDYFRPCIPDGSIVDCECVFEHRDANEQVSQTSALWTVSAAEAVARQQERGWAKFYLFDMTRRGTTDIRNEPLWRRLAHLYRHRNWLPNGFEILPTYGIRKTFNQLRSWIPRDTGGKRFMDWLLPAIDYPSIWHAYLERGGEGLVLKDAQSIYDHTEDHRGRDWLKYKKGSTLEAFVTGWNESTTDSRIGQVRSINFSVFDKITGEIKEIASIGAFPEFQRKQFLTSVGRLKTEYLGRVACLDYQDVGVNGRLVHATFNHWRTEKAPEECIL